MDTAAASQSARFPLTLLALFIPWWVVFAIAPWYRQDWLLENVLVFIVVPVLILNYRRLRFSNAAYFLIFVFLLFHVVGAHYTYAEVPYDAWSRALFGVSINEVFGFQRNHFDRLVHFLYGLLITPAAIELLDARAPQRGLWRWWLPFLFMASHAGLYELLEWGAAEVFGGELGQAYLGTQGDVWDAHRDSALAAIGSVISLIGCRWGRDGGQ